MATAPASNGARLKIVWTGDDDAVYSIRNHVDDNAADRLMGFHYDKATNVGESRFEEFTHRMAECDSVVLVFSKCLSEDNNNYDESVSLYHLVFAVAKHDKPKCLLLIGVSNEEVPAGLLNFPTVMVESVEEISEKHLLEIEGHLAKIKVEKADSGNMSQAQAFSNFFGYFDFILPGLCDKFTKFEESAHYEELKKSKPGYTFRTFNRFVEVVVPSGPRVEFDKVEGLVPLEKWWGNTEVDKKMKEEVKEMFTTRHDRAMMKLRPYNAYATVVYDDKKKQGIVFTGQCAPACNIIHHLKGKSGEKDSMCYANTSAKIANHPNNEDCNDKLFVYYGPANAQDLFNALDKQLLEPEQEVVRCAENRKIQTCLILNDQLENNDPAFNAKHDEFVEKVLNILAALEVERTIVEFGETDFEKTSADLVILLVSEGCKKDQLLAEFQASADSNWKLLIIQTSSEHQNITLTPFIEEHGKIVDDRLCVSSKNFEKKFTEILQNGHRHLLDMMLLNRLYIGLAHAFVINYLKLNIKRFKKKANDEGLLSRLYQIIPDDGDVRDKADINGITKVEDVELKVNARTFGTPIFKLDIKEASGSKEVKFFMEYNTACSTFPRIKKSKFCAVLNEKLLRREVAFFSVELQALISKDEDLRDFVRIIPLKNGEDSQTAHEKIRKYIEKDYLALKMAGLKL